LDFYLSSGDEVLHLPVNPEELSIQSGAKVQTVSVLDLGDIALPRGNTPARVTFDCFFPGAARQSDPWWRAPWRPPLEYVAVLGQWKANHARVRLLVTDSQVSGWDLVIEQFDRTERGGAGDIYYSLAMIEARELRVLTDQEVLAQAQAAGADVGLAALGASRSEPERPATWTVAPGQTLWEIARRAYGDGGRWRDVWQANLDLIGPNPDSITAGMELALP
jgi:LysM repeat protein